MGSSKGSRIALLVAAVTLIGCEEEEDPQAACRKVCLRVARCRREAQVGKPIPGERGPVPDARCMKRCTDQPDRFAACEAKMRTCDQLRPCYGPLR